MSSRLDDLRMPPRGRWDCDCERDRDRDPDFDRRCDCVFRVRGLGAGGGSNMRDCPSLAAVKGILVNWKGLMGGRGGRSAWAWACGTLIGFGTGLPSLDV